MKKIIIIIGITIVFPVLFGCSSMNQRKLLVDKNWGRSYETMHFNQMVNPDAGESMAEEQNIDGVAAEHNYNKYQKDFKKQEAPSQVFNINLGGK